MDLQRINKHKQSFDDICHYIEDDNGADKVEVWFARELQIILGYARWENFQVALTRAVESCKTQNINICLLYTSPSPRDPKTSRMPSSA